MIRRITLQNFMSHRHTVIEPADGLTVLVGENNCGKSAVVAALQILCNNASGEYMVRHGQEECRVTVETDEGHVVEWKRDGGTVSYALNGQPVHRLRGGIPDDLHKLLRMPQVYPQDGGEPFDIHFGEQKKPVFLLDESGGRAAKFFASSSDAEALIRMQILHKDNVREASQKSSHLLDQQRLIDRRLEPLEPIEDIQDRLDELDGRYTALMTMRKKAEALDQDIQVLQESVDETALFETKACIVAKLETPPCMRDTHSLAELTESLSRWWESFRHFEGQEQTLRGLQTPPRLVDTSALEVLVPKIPQASHEFRRVTQMTLILSSLGAVPKLAPTGGLEKACEEIERCSESFRHFEDQEQTLHGLQAPPRLADTAALEILVPKISQASHEVRRVTQMTLILSNLSAVPRLTPTDGLDKALEEIKRCIDQSRHRIERANCVARLQPPPELFDARSLLNRIAEIASASNNRLYSQEKATALGRCESPPELRNESALGDLVGKLRQSASEMVGCLSVCRVLGVLSHPPSQVDPSSLGTLITEWEATLHRIDTLQQKFDQAVSSAIGAERAVRDWAEENRICPTCGAELDPDRLIAMTTSTTGGHIHG